MTTRARINIDARSTAFENCDKLAKMASGLSSNLLTPIEKLPQMDASRASLLARLELRRAVDLLFFFPRTYEQPAPRTNDDQFQENLRVSFTGTVIDISEKVTQSGKHMFGLLLRTDNGGNVRLMWFNQMFRRNMYRRNERLVATGILRSTGLNWEMIQPQTSPADEQQVEADRPQPIYSLTEGLKQSAMRAIMKQYLPPLIEEIDEALPEAMRSRLEIPGVHQALHDIHFPATEELAAAAQRRFKLQELLVLQLALSMQRQQRERSSQAPICEPSGKIHSRILNRLPHTLTPDQQTSIDEIRQDMARPIPMNRLLQGDVGSGKTLVAQYAMLLCVANEHQATLMAPTEVLARQHYANLQKSLSHSRVRIGLLVGTLSKKERNSLLELMAAGEVDVVVGTQALLSEDVQFKRLGLVIVDEQHKFGVLQRARLRHDNLQPHNLILSATPIPRTIAMTAFGDLDVSTIRTKPPGRAPVHTYLAKVDQLESWWKFVDKQIEQGRQAYVIAPRVAQTAVDEEDESSVGTKLIASAEGAFSELRQGPFAHRRLGMLHGRLDSEVKESVLEQFANGELDILVSTTVVEVGIDVPNATVITILDANRLGLSQLHQLRGRISRGSFPGYACAVASDGCDATDNDRLKAFEQSNDGFELAEMDLKLRGPGDLLGTSQSGLPTMRIANIVEDGDLLELARKEAREILQNDPELADPDLSKLVNQTLKRYGKSLQLGDVG